MMRLDLTDKASSRVTTEHAYLIKEHNNNKDTQDKKKNVSKTTWPTTSSPTTSPTTTSPTTTETSQQRSIHPHPIPAIYRFLFIYLEPLFALNGAYLLLFSPSSFVSAVSSPPSSLSPQPQQDHNNNMRIITDQLGILHLVFAFNLAVVLGSTRDLRTWRLMCVGMLISDVLHVLAQARELGWETLCAPGEWRPCDWANVGVLGLMLSSRLGAVVGWGIRYP